jgi:hypothetical protein
MVKNLSLLVYTNSKCKDLHEGYFSRIKKFFPSLKNIFATSDEPIEGINFIEYNNDSFHYEQMINALDLIPTDYVLYNQEDYILFDYVLEDKIKKYLEILENDKNISFIRLIYSGVNDFEIKPYKDDLFYLNPNSFYFYSTQATIWRKEDLKQMFLYSKVKQIFDEPENSFYLKSLNKKGLCSIEKGKKVGGHYNSLVYPYIATALVKGEWNYSEYQEELDDFFNEFKIKKELRGER